MNVSRRIRVGIAVAVVATLTALGLVLAFVIDREARIADEARVTAEVEQVDRLIFTEHRIDTEASSVARDPAALRRVERPRRSRIGRPSAVLPSPPRTPPADVAAAMPPPPAKPRVQVETHAGRARWSERACLPDATGRPAFVLRVVSPPTLRNAAHRTIAYIAAALILAAGFFLLVVHWLGASAHDVARRPLRVRAGPHLRRADDGGHRARRPRPGRSPAQQRRGQTLTSARKPLEEAAAAWLATVLGDLTRPAEQVPLGPREVQVPQSGGVALDLEIAAQPISRGAQNILCVVMRDVSERKRVEHRIRHQAWHDGLTELPNRALFNDRLGIALAQTRRTPEKIGVLLLDLDHFKTINDTLGHDQPATPC